MLPDVLYRLIDPILVHIARTARARSSERHPTSMSRTSTTTSTTTITTTAITAETIKTSPRNHRIVFFFASLPTLLVELYVLLSIRYFKTKD